MMLSKQGPELNSKRGAILLLVMGLMAFMVCMVAVLSIKSMQTQQLFREASASVARENAVDSIIDMVIFEILRDRNKSAYLAASEFVPAPQPFADYRVRISDVRGLIDVNSADPTVLLRLGLARNLVVVNTDPDSRFEHVGDVARYWSLSAAELYCVVESTTFYSVLTEPDWQYSPKSLRQIFGANRLSGPLQRSLLEGPPSVIGQHYQLIIIVPHSPNLRTIITFYLSGRLDTPYFIREKYSLPGCASTKEI